MYCGVLNYARAAITFLLTLADTSFSDANGWNVENKYATIRLVDVNNDGKADICGRYIDGYRCSLSHSLGFPTFGASQLWIKGFGYIDKWDADASYWRTVQPLQRTSPLPHAVAVCGRSTGGIWCSDYN